MKVFTVGLGDKDGAKKPDPQKPDSNGEMTKIPIDSNASSPAVSPAPIIIPRGPPRKAMMRSCGLLSWFIGAFFIILLCLTISEISYNRQRDQAYLRLKWAELRQKMIGYEILSQVQQQQQQQQPKQEQPLDERLAFSNRNIPEVLPLRETPTVSNTVDNEVTQEEKKADDSSMEGDARFVFLRALLDRMRKKAAEFGLTGDMQVHVIEVKPVSSENQQRDGMSQRAWEDGFGEVAVPKQYFGPYPREEEYSDFENFRHPQLPQVPQVPQVAPFFPPWPTQFDRWSGPVRAPNWNNQWDRRPFPEFETQEGNNDFLFHDNFERPQERMEWGRSGFPRWNNQWDQPQPFQGPFPQEPSVGRQNQFPFPVQNQVPIVGTAGENQQQQQQKPWYMNGGDDERWTQTWNNDWTPDNSNEEVMNKAGPLPFQPHPAASNKDLEWEQPQDSDGIDNFVKQEKFNVPIDVAVDDEPKTIEKSDSFKVNSWQHTQPDAAKEEEPSSAPIVSSSAQVGSNEEKDFLPLRSEELLDNHLDHPDKVHDDEDLDKKFKSPFFQIDYPN